MEKASVLVKLGKNSILATDIANQFWCERQMECNYLYGKKYTAAMRQGKKVNEALQNETYVPLTVEPVTYDDFLYKLGYENYMSLLALKSVGVCREVRIYGSVAGYKLVGQVDELKIVDGKTVVVETKTSASGASIDGVRSRPHIVQIMLYKRLLDDIRSRSYSFSNFSLLYRTASMKLSDTFVRGLTSIGVKSEFINVQEVYKLMFEELCALPEISDRLDISYVDRYSGKQVADLEVNYDPGKIGKDLMYAMRYWNGERESAPVPEEEKWKCNICKFFGKECTVWWKK